MLDEVINHSDWDTATKLKNIILDREMSIRPVSLPRSNVNLACKDIFDYFSSKLTYLTENDDKSE